MHTSGPARYTETYNPHWVEEGRHSHYAPFPPHGEYPHLVDLFALLEAERIHFFEKSRDMNGDVGMRGLPHAESDGGARPRSLVSDPEREKGQATH
jgi:hypothetical protein